jgi:hypothetical protein
LDEEPIKVLDSPGNILDLFSERGKTMEIFEALAVYWGSFIGMVWYYE